MHLCIYICIYAHIHMHICTYICIYNAYCIYWFVVQLLSCVQLFATSWIAAHLASLSFPISQSLLKLMSQLSQWCHPTISSSVIPFSSCFFNLSQDQGLFQMWWPEYWRFSFSISPSSIYSGLISFRFYLLAVEGNLESSPAPQLEGINSLVVSLLYGSTLTSVRDYREIHSSDHTDLCQQSDVSAF